MYIEELSDGYWLTELEVTEWDKDYAVMDTADHSALAEFVYGCADHPFLIKERRNTGKHLPVYPEQSIPANTVVVPSEGAPSFEIDTEEVLVVKIEEATHIEFQRENKQIWISSLSPESDVLLSVSRLSNNRQAPQTSSLETTPDSSQYAPFSDQLFRTRIYLKKRISTELFLPNGEAISEKHRQGP